MKSQLSSLKLKKPNLLVIRRVTGASMEPNIHSGQVIIASTFKKPAIGAVVVLRHEGLDKIKRVKKIAGDNVYVWGDNHGASSDSKQFGWLSKSSILATVIWPNYQQKR